MSMPSRIKTDLMLLFIAAIWGSGFVAQKFASAEMSSFTFNGLRFLLGGILIMLGLRFRVPRRREEWGWIGLGGLLLFGGSSLQQIGIKDTTAANAGFLTGLYVVIIPLLLFLFGRERLMWYTWVAAFLAVLGTLLLSAKSLSLSLNRGDGIVLAGALIWALHVIVVGRAARRMSAFQFAAGQFLVCGVLNWITVLLTQTRDWQELSLVGVASVGYSTIFVVALGFTLQVVAQRWAHPADAAIIFSTEAVFAAIFGMLILGESMEAVQWLGAGMIMMAMMLSQWQSLAALRAQAGNSDLSPDVPYPSAKTLSSDNTP